MGKGKIVYPDKSEFRGSWSKFMANGYGSKLFKNESFY